MSVDTSLTKEQFNNGIRVNAYIEDLNKFYNTRSTGGYSSCIPGSPVRDKANVLCNCVGFANGAFNETYVKCKRLKDPSFIEKQHFRFATDARGFIKVAKTLGLQIIPSSGIPIPGSMIVWGAKGNHVAFVSEVIDKDNIVILQAGWATSSWTLRNKANTGWVCDRRVCTRNGGGSNQWKYSAYYPAGAECLGFILNPAVESTPIDSPENYPCEVRSIKQLDRTSIRISGYLGGIQSITEDNILYYKWDSSTVSSTFNDGYILVSKGKLFNDRTYEILLKKPLNVSKISVLPIQVNNGFDNFSGKIYTSELIASIPCINISLNNIYKQGIPCIFTDGEWHKGIPCIFTDGEWHKIYNDKR